MKKRKNDYLQPILTIGISLIFTFGLFYGIKSVMTTEDISIYKNTAEEYLYQGRYDEAIAEYDAMQKKDTWPIWTVKKAEIYSIKGDLKKSTAVLKEAVLTRNKLLDEKKETYIEKDPAFINEVILLLYMNKEYDEAISLGEDYILNNEVYKPLLKTMFTIYAEIDMENKADNMIKEYGNNSNSAYDLAVLAEMNMVMKYYDEGFAKLKEAWDLDKNELKILEVVRANALSNEDSVIAKLNELIEEYSSKEIYKVWLAETYIANGETNDSVTYAINGVKDEEVGESILNVIRAQYYILQDDNSETKKYITKLIETEETTSVGYYLQGIQYYNKQEYDKAMISSKKSILANENSVEVYGDLIPNILLKKSEVNSILPYYITALHKEPYNYNIIVNIANYYKNIALLDDVAESYYTQALKLNPMASELQYDLALVDLNNGNVEEAINKLNQAISLDNSKIKYFRTLGTIYLNNEDYENAIENIRKAFEIDENDVLTLNNAGCYYVMSKENVWRGYENLKAAYEEMPKDLEKEYVRIITKNYELVQGIYDKLVEAEESDETIEYEVPKFELFN